MAKEYVASFAQAILLDEERQDGNSGGESASHIEGGSVPHRGAASSETGDCAGPSESRKELALGDSPPLQLGRNGSRRRAKKRKQRPEKTQGGAPHVLPKKKIRVPSKEDKREQRAPLVYEELSEDDMDPNDRPDGGVLREPTQNPGEQTVLLSALTDKHRSARPHNSEGMDSGCRDEVAPVLGDRSLPVPAGGDIVAAALSSAISDPTSDDELLQFAAEIELGGGL